MADAAAAKTADDIARLRDVKLARAVKAQKMKRKTVERLAKEKFIKTELGQLPAAVKKHAKELEDDGVIFGIMHGILGKTPGMPAPGAKPVLKALRPGLPVLKKEVKGEPGMVACLNGFEHWMLCGGGTKRVEAMGAAAPKCMIIMYEADILDEDLCVKWWEERCAANTALKDGADAGMDNADRLTKEAEEAAHTSKDTSQQSKLAQQTERAAKRTSEAAKCGGGATGEEEAWEKQANQEYRKAIRAREQIVARAAATKKNADELHQEKLAAEKRYRELREESEGLRLVNEAMAPFFEWLEEADEESDED